MPIPGARRSMSIALPGARAAQIGFKQGAVSNVVFPWPGAATDLDFVRRQYRWNNANRTEADFTTLVLNGATFGTQGLDFSTCSANPSITIALAALGIAIPPFSYAFAWSFASTPAAAKTILEFDDATNNERFLAALTTVPQMNLQTIDGGVIQSSQVPGAITAGVRAGSAFSAQLNEVLMATNGVGATADIAATMPTVTTLRLGANNIGGTFPPAILSRLVIFTAVKTQAEINALSTQIRDAA